MNPARQIEITYQHRNRLAIAYVRTACAPETPDDLAGIERQRAQVGHARAWGWPETAIQVIEDRGRSGQTAEHREGYLRLCGQIAAGTVGLVLVTDVARLTRSPEVFAQFLALCRRGNTLLAVDGRLVDPASLLRGEFDPTRSATGDGLARSWGVREEIQAIFRRYSEGMTLAAIVEALHKGGLGTTGPA